MRMAEVTYRSIKSLSAQHSESQLYLFEGKYERERGRLKRRYVQHCVRERVRLILA